MKASNSTSRHTFPASGSSSPRSMPINKFSSLCPLLGLGPADGAFYPSSPLSHTHTLQQRPPHPPIPTSARSRAPCSCPISSALVWKFPTPTGPEACHTHPHLCPRGLQCSGKWQPVHPNLCLPRCPAFMCNCLLPST